MGILVAIALGTALASAARLIGHEVTERTNPDLLAPYRYLHDLRIDCFVLGLVAGAISLTAATEELSQMGLWTIGLVLAFAAFLGTDGLADARPGSSCQRALGNVHSLLLGPIAVVAGWLCASTIVASLLDF